MINDNYPTVVVGSSYKDITNRILPTFFKTPYSTEIESVVYSIPVKVKKLSGDYIYFVSESHYRTWCKGRTYWLNGQLYRSGYPFKIN